jgi:hypothetical protein
LTSCNTVICRYKSTETFETYTIHEIFGKRNLSCKNNTNIKRVIPLICKYKYTETFETYTIHEIFGKRNLSCNTVICRYKYTESFETYTIHEILGKRNFVGSHLCAGLIRIRFSQLYPACKRSPQRMHMGGAENVWRFRSWHERKL